MFGNRQVGVASEVMNTDQVASYAQFIAAHVYQEESVEQFAGEHHPRATERGRREVDAASTKATRIETEKGVP